MIRYCSATREGSYSHTIDVHGKQVKIDRPWIASCGLGFSNKEICLDYEKTLRKMYQYCGLTANLDYFTSVTPENMKNFRIIYIRPDNWEDFVETDRDIAAQEHNQFQFKINALTVK